MLGHSALEALVSSPILGATSRTIWRVTVDLSAKHDLGNLAVRTGRGSRRLFIPNGGGGGLRHCRGDENTNASSGPERRDAGRQTHVLCQRAPPPPLDARPLPAPNVPRFSPHLKPAGRFEGRPKVGDVHSRQQHAPRPSLGVFSPTPFPPTQPFMSSRYSLMS